MNYTMNTYKKNWPKLIISFFICFLIRLIPFRPPNIEPILSTQMPFARAYGAYAGFMFGFFSIVFYDLVTGTLGIWSLLTAGTYGVLGFWSALYLKNKKSVWNYVFFAVIGTIFFDAVTGLSIGPLFFHQPFMGALVGQIPFTALHLLGNVGFAFTLSPAVYRFVIDNPKIEFSSIINIFNRKQI